MKDHKDFGFFCYKNNITNIAFSLDMVAIELTSEDILKMPIVKNVAEYQENTNKEKIIKHSSEKSYALLATLFNFKKDKDTIEKILYTYTLKDQKFIPTNKSVNPSTYPNTETHLKYILLGFLDAYTKEKIIEDKIETNLKTYTQVITNYISQAIKEYPGLKYIFNK